MSVRTNGHNYAPISDFAGRVRERAVDHAARAGESDEGDRPHIQSGGGPLSESDLGNSATGAERVAMQFSTVAARIEAVYSEAKAMLLAQVEVELRRFVGDMLGGTPPDDGAGMGDIPLAIGGHVTAHRDGLTPNADGGPGSADHPSDVAQRGPRVPLREPTQQSGPVSPPTAHDRVGPGAASGVVRPSLLLVDAGQGDDEARVTPSTVEDAVESPTGNAHGGTTRLSVKSVGSTRAVLSFVDELCRKPDVRLLRLVGKHTDGLDMWVGLRRPMSLEGMLSQMPGVASVSDVPVDYRSGEQSHLAVLLGSVALPIPA